MKKIGYHIFAFFYFLCCICKVKPKKVFCIMTHDDSEGSNVGVLINELKKFGYSDFYYLKKSERESVKKSHKIKEVLQFFFVKPYHLATSEYVLQDNIFLPMAYIRFRSNVKVVQLWHGTGTIKRFGQSVNTGALKQLEQRANRTITHLIINSRATREPYQEAFGVESDKIYELGLPRTDVLFDEPAKEDMLEKFYKTYPNLKDKYLVLYAPTFRDNSVNHPTLSLKLKELLKELPKGYCIGLKVHPYVAKQFELTQTLTKEEQERVYNFSDYEELNTLLVVSDVLVTDYSSIIFEYSILEKPMIFYAYDYQEFLKNGRGFYEDYEKFVPGPIVYSQEELVRVLCEKDYDMRIVETFKLEQFKYLDGQARKRIMKTIFLPE